MEEPSDDSGYRTFSFIESRMRLFRSISRDIPMNLKGAHEI